MTGNRKPSNDRITLPSIDTTITIQCRICFGDGWHYPSHARRVKLACPYCGGTGKRQVLLIEKRPVDVVITDLGGIA
jgi:hypothetical protein